MLTPKEQHVYDMILAVFNDTTEYGRVDHLDRDMLHALLATSMSRANMNGVLRRLCDKGVVEFRAGGNHIVMVEQVSLAMQDDDCTCHNCNAIRKLCEHIRNGNTVFMYADDDGFHVGHIMKGNYVNAGLAQDIRVYCSPVSEHHEFAKAVLSCTS